MPTMRRSEPASMAPRARVGDLAREFGICTSLIYRWRRSMLSPPLSAPAVKLVPVRVIKGACPGDPAWTERRLRDLE